MQERTDIIQLLLDKNEKAIDLIYDDYGPNLYGYILKMMDDEIVAQDILQESFIKIWKNAQQYDPKKSRLFTWLLTICRNTAIDRLRSIKNKREKKNQMAEQVVYNEKISSLNVDHLDLKEKVAGLEDKYKSIIDVLFFMGMTQKEASDFLEIPIGTVKSRLRIALRELQKIYAFKQNEINALVLLLWMIG